jgi:hypothetical protein
MKNTLLILAICILGLSGCKDKEDTRPECEQNGTGTITVTVKFDNPYEIYVNDEFNRIAESKRPATISLSKGDYKLKAIQASGYLLFPTERETSFHVEQCAERNWTIQ